jgi:beta-lactam-binding protein with PASTA domain
VELGVLNSTLSVFRRLMIVIGIAVAFLFGMATTVYLSLLSPEVTVPEVLGKDRFEAERTLSEVGLKFRVRATRASNQVNPDTVLFQLPRAGEVVKVGQTVALDISRVTKEGEASQVVTPVEEKRSSNTNANDNKPKHPKVTNKNANENVNENASQNENSNTSSNVNRSSNASRARTVGANANASNENKAVVNQNDEGRDTDSQNSNKRPTAKPSPAVKNDNRDNR